MLCITQRCCTGHHGYHQCYIAECSARKVTAALASSLTRYITYVTHVLRQLCSTAVQQLQLLYQGML
jgi:hypothetical protein